jgi:hypothetical protein
MDAENLIIEADNVYYKEWLTGLSIGFGAIGATLTLFTIYQMLKKPKPLHIDTKISIIILVIGFIGSLSNIAKGVLIKWPYNIYALDMDTCILDYLTAGMFNTIDDYSIVMLSFERMLLIIFQITLSNNTWFFLIALFTLIHAILVVIVCVNKEFLFSAISFGCILNLYSKLSFITKYFAIIYALSFILVLTNYSMIMAFIYCKSKNQSYFGLNKSLVRREQLKILSRSILIIATFIAAYIGKDLAWFYQWITGRKRPWNLDYVGNIMQLMHTSANCLVVLYMDPTLYEESLNRLKLIVAPRDPEIGSIDNISNQK